MIRKIKNISASPSFMSFLFSRSVYYQIKNSNLIEPMWGLPHDMSTHNSGLR